MKKHRVCTVRRTQAGYGFEKFLKRLRRKLYSYYCFIWNVGGQAHWQLYFEVLRLQQEEQHETGKDSAICGPQAGREHVRFRRHRGRPTNGSCADEQSVDRDYSKYDSGWNRLVYYMFRVPRHCGVVCNSLQLCHRHIYPKLCEAAVMGRPLVVTACGGGPGSDFLGLLAYLDGVGWFCKHKPQTTPKKLILHTLDLRDWSSMWSHVQKSLDRCYSGVEVHFHAADLTTPEAVHSVPADTDLVLFSYFMEDMIPFEQKFVEFFKLLVREVNPGTLFVALDNKVPAVTKLRNTIFSTLQADLETVATRYVRSRYPCAVFQPAAVGPYEPSWVEMSVRSELYAW
eukprot:CAMPEP_0174284136 /NCGR_PEP_ID=MMETSP0809-20121228/4878_1 /TAXON_ID=73025 ORGANISM="Eutreptiella gymnastica-like, Strain CCMP1594" /NCGR_SAMPLE_ID=MMETSP0809 /ASSEMBLY_ACC=CAM_ASM_000658 /LENGTH=341 /DNA_ID=CAMNT_0015379477 /DNA_START=113 /DNA_END=1135 /DNA_ORIENTATION=+